MIPAIFQPRPPSSSAPANSPPVRQAPGPPPRSASSRPIGAFGGFLINRGFGMSFAATGSPAAAFVAFGLFYTPPASPSPGGATRARSASPGSPASPTPASETSSLAR
ncbi:hypothetical protein [Nonomuraea dietziae]|uniref:hypothetical protein n=1 Tax=Nonomuraea dietziae TaxID=65515 RepID=UPI0031CED76D